VTDDYGGALTGASNAGEDCWDVSGGNDGGNSGQERLKVYVGTLLQCTCFV
jgi:hypothetical protein